MKKIGMTVLMILGSAQGYANTELHFADGATRRELAKVNATCIDQQLEFLKLGSQHEFPYMSVSSDEEGYIGFYITNKSESGEVVIYKTGANVGNYYAGYLTVHINKDNPVYFRSMEPVQLKYRRVERGFKRESDRFFGVHLPVPLIQKVPIVNLLTGYKVAMFETEKYVDCFKREIKNP